MSAWTSPRVPSPRRPASVTPAPNRRDQLVGPVERIDRGQVFQGVHPQGQRQRQFHAADCPRRDQQLEQRPLRLPHCFRPTAPGLTATFTFTAGTSYAVNMTFVHSTGPWGLQLHWLSAGPQPFAEEAIEPATPVGVNVERRFRTFANAAVFDGDKLRRGQCDCRRQLPRRRLLFYATARRAAAVTNGYYLVTFTGEAALSGWTTRSSIRQRTRLRQRRCAPSTADATALGEQCRCGHVQCGHQHHHDRRAVPAGRRHVPQLRPRPADRNRPDRHRFTNLQVMEPTSPGATTYFPLGTEFTPAALSLASNFTVFRFEDFTGYEARTSTGRRPRSPDGPHKYAKPIPARTAGRPGSTPSILQRHGKDMYVNLPVAASDAYVTSLAEAIKYGSNADGTPYTGPTANPVCPPLNPNLNVYIELADEIWNSAPPWNEGLSGPAGHSPRTQSTTTRTRRTTIPSIPTTASTTSRPWASFSWTRASTSRQISAGTDNVSRSTAPITW